LRKISIEMMNLMCMFDHSGRAALKEDMRASLPYIEDTDMADLMRQTIDMVEAMTDEEFAEIEFEPTWDDDEGDAYADTV
jgi:hypothetical protein